MVVDPKDPRQRPEMLKFMRELSKTLAKDGKLIETGFMSFQKFCIPPDAPHQQIVMMRMAFFAGAQHLFGSIMSVLDPEIEPTEEDLKVMDSINAELAKFGD